jgi:hypothetical protein
MINMINKIKYSLKFARVMITRYRKPLLALIGLCLFSAYFWMRFLRIRTVKELPLNLSIEGFFILLYIVCIFTYIIISLIFIKNSNPLIEKVIDIVFIPLKELDKSFKNIPIVKKYYETILIKILPHLEKMINKTNWFFIIFWIVPRVILLLVLGLDIFYFAKFEHRYKFVFIGLFLLFNGCFKYSLKNTKDQMYEDIKLFVDGIGTKYYQYVHPSELAPDFDPEDEDEGLLWESVRMNLPLDVFLKHRAEYLVYKNINNKYSIGYSSYCYEYFQMKYLGFLLPKRRIDLSDEEYKNYKTPYGNYDESWHNISRKQKEYMDPKVHLLVRLAVLLEYYNKTTNKTPKYKYLKIIIFTGYLICWLYVLIISYPNISMEEWNKLIMYLERYKDILEITW